MHFSFFDATSKIIRKFRQSAKIIAKQIFLLYYINSVGRDGEFLLFHFFPKYYNITETIIENVKVKKEVFLC